MPYSGSGTFSPFTPGNPVVSGAVISATDHNNTIADIASGLSNAVTRDGQSPPTANLPMASFKLTGLAAGATAGDSVRYEQIAPDSLGVPVYAMLRSYLAGCTMSTAGSSTTMSIAAGIAMDSTNAYPMTVAAIGKLSSGGTWVVGTGQPGLDTGAIANNTWYHFYAIRRPDTGVTDVIFSTNATTPTLPASYTQYRRIGSGLTDGSAQWTAFTQKGDYFRWATVKADVSAAAPGIGDILRTLSVPLGVSVQVFGSVRLTGADYVFISDPASTAESADATHFTFNATAASGTNYTCRTDTSKQVRTSLNTGAVTLTMFTEGYYDTRGRDA